ncbi:MAG: DUF998 domain-containing protein [Candidatus Aenigmarchaeota archaeon]|nr:DUF998 domain-containing protein [Candidatus Aenigmarchaeota archaeon]
MKKSDWRKIAGYCGLLAPSIAVVSIVLAILASPNFSFAGNALSDLGIEPGIAALLFNYGLIVSGMLFLAFSFGLFARLAGAGRLGAAVMALASIALAAVGAFPENLEPLHFYASFSYFLLFPLATLLVATALSRDGEKRLAWRGYVSVLIAFASILWIARSGHGIAIPEIVHALAMFWLPFVLGRSMAGREKFTPSPAPSGRLRTSSPASRAAGR